MRVWGSGREDWGRRTTVVLAGVTVMAVGAACSGGGGGGDKKQKKDVLTLNLSPRNGQNGLRPDSAIAVQAQHGTIQNVAVSTAGTKVDGDLSADRTQWRSRWTLDPGRTYTVTATAVGKDGKAQTATSRFTTAKATKRAGVTYAAPDNREVVGVGMPIILDFERKVMDKAAVERALEVRSSRPVEGAWHWFGNQQVVFRTKNYWPAHTKVSFRAHLSGVATAKQVYGGKNFKVDFAVGDEHISTAGEDSHKMVVRKNGKKVRTIPVSMGRGGAEKYTTTNGKHLTMEKGNPVIMDSATVGCGPGCPGYYRLSVDYAVRISNSGEYVHSAPWSVGSQGNSNVSHGCINASPENARWFYNFAYRGDPFEVTGSSRKLDPENGWSFWQLNWKNWVKGSGLKASVTTAPLEPAGQSSNGSQGGGGAVTEQGSAVNGN